MKRRCWNCQENLRTVPWSEEMKVYSSGLLTYQSKGMKVIDQICISGSSKLSAGNILYAQHSIRCFIVVLVKRVRLEMRVLVSMYVISSEMVRLIGTTMGRRIRLWRVLTPFVKLASKIPGRIGGLADKAFGSLTVDRELSSREITGYQICSLEESIRRSCTPAKIYPEKQS